MRGGGAGGELSELPVGLSVTVCLRASAFGAAAAARLGSRCSQHSSTAARRRAGGASKFKLSDLKSTWYS
eukprot:SAG31_NODE_1756_length_7343_cov_2.790309_1_plen_70_part_00